MSRHMRRRARAGRSFAERSERTVWVTITATGTVTDVLGPVPFTLSLPPGSVLLDLQVALSLLVPRLQAFPAASVRFLLNGLWTGEIDRDRPLRPGDRITLASEAPARHGAFEAGGSSRS